jgi:hypothetical protein
MSACLLVAGREIVLAAAMFTLTWTHSVEKTGWEEDWRVTPAGLALVEARVRGSGAGMEPGEGAVLRDGWWRWTPRQAPLPRLTLAASGATGQGWRLCHDGECEEIGGEAGNPVEIAPCG